MQHSEAFLLKPSTCPMVLCRPNAVNSLPVMEERQGACPCLNRNWTTRWFTLSPYHTGGLDSWTLYSMRNISSSWILLLGPRSLHYCYLGYITMHTRRFPHDIHHLWLLSSVYRTRVTYITSVSIIQFYLFYYVFLICIDNNLYTNEIKSHSCIYIWDNHRPLMLYKNLNKSLMVYEKCVMMLKIKS